MTHLIGLIAGSLLVALPIPQLISVLRTGNATGINPAMWWLVTTCSVLWAGYGLHTHATVLLLANVASLLPLLAVNVTVTALRTHHKRATVATVAVPVTAAATVLAGTVIPAAMIATLAVSVSLLSAVPQLVTSVASYRHGRTTAVSLGSMTVLAVMQLLWIAYGIQIDDTAVTATNMICLCSTVTIVTVTAASRHRFATA